MQDASLLASREGAREFAPAESPGDHGSVDEVRDHDGTCARILARWTASAGARSELLARIVEETKDDARPAIESALFVVEMGRGADPLSLELHEAAAMWTLLGRHLATHATTATATLDYADSILRALDAEGFWVDASVRASLIAVFTEGYVLAREEQARESAESEQLAALVPRTIGEGIELLVLTGPYDAGRLAEALEEWVRDVFRRGTRVVVIDVLGARNLAAVERAIREACLVLVSLGVEIIVAGEARDLPREAHLVSSFDEALSAALSAREISNLAFARVKRLFRRA